METTRSDGKQLSVIRDTDSSCADESEEETKIGGVETEETGIDVNFKVAASSHVALPVAFVFLYFPA